MNRTSKLVGFIDTFRAIFLALFGLLSIPVLLIGTIAFLDYGDRGCFEAEVNQCSDALDVISLAVGYVAAGFLFWFFLKFLRNRAEARKGQTNA